MARNSARRTRTLATSSLVVLSLLSTEIACFKPGPPARPNLILFTIDTLRADHVGCYGGQPGNPSPSPFLDRIATEGVRFERCFVPRGMTHPSLASMLTGKYPISHGLRDNGQSLDPSQTSIATQLKRVGYRTAGFAANLDRARWDFWMRGFEVAEDGPQGNLIDEGRDRAFEFQRVWDRRVCDKAIEWVEALPDDGVPFFLWVHLYDVHAPYTPLDDDVAPYVDPQYDGTLRYPIGLPGEAQSDLITPQITDFTLGARRLDDADLRQINALYDGGLVGADRKLSIVYDALERRGFLDDSLLLISADHGEELADHHRFFGHGASIYDSTLHVPLIARSTRQQGGTDGGGRSEAGLTQNLDIFPTLLEAAGVPIPAECEGSSLYRCVIAGETPTRTHVFAEWEDLIYSVSDGDWKLIYNPKGARPRKPPYNIAPPQVGFPYQCYELYHVATDRREQVNLFSRSHPKGIELNRVLAKFLADEQHLRPMVFLDPNAAAEDFDALEQLGYVGSTEGRNVATIPCGETR